MLDSFYVDMAGKKYGEGLEDQLTSMKEDLKALKSRRDDLQEDNALSNGRILASRPSTTSHNALVAEYCNFDY